MVGKDGPYDDIIGNGDTAGESAQPSSSEPDSQRSHRRRRLLAAYHKDFIGEHPKHDSHDDENCMMAMGRASSEAATSSPTSHPEDEVAADGGEDQTGQNLTEAGEATQEVVEGEDTEGEEEDTNLDGELRGCLLEGRVLPNPEITAGLGATPTHITYQVTTLQQGTLGIPAAKFV